MGNIYKDYNIPVLNYLSDEYFITIEELVRILSVNRQIIETQINKISKIGYHISCDNEKGYKIISRPDILLPFEIKNNLSTRYLGKNVYYYQKLSSTNTVAKKMILESKDKLAEGTIVIAEEQSEGRGRSGKNWVSPPGGLWLSIVLFPTVKPADFTLITLTMAVAVAKTIKQLSDKINVQIKWPNDILIGNKKICGILTEVNIVNKRIQWAIVGIGINVNNESSFLPINIKESSVSLKDITGQIIDRVNLAQLLLMEIEKQYDILKKGGFETILKEWKSYNNSIGKEIKIATEKGILDGRVVDINERGSLMLKTVKENIYEIISGTVLP